MNELKGKKLLAYVAGIVDGEGHIGITSHITHCKKGESKAWNIRVVVVNSNPWLIQFLRMQFGGHYGKQTLNSLRHKQSWYWQITSQKAGEFLRLILPYLQLKKPQAELALQFQARRRRTGGKFLNATEKLLDEANKITMNAFNKKGG